MHNQLPGWLNSRSQNFFWGSTWLSSIKLKNRFSFKKKFGFLLEASYKKKTLHNHLALQKFWEFFLSLFFFENSTSKS